MLSCAGPIPETLGALSNLTELDLSLNSFEGTASGLFVFASLSRQSIMETHWPTGEQVLRTQRSNFLNTHKGSARVLQAG